MYTPTTIYLRADGNSHIGLGHVHRLLALAEMLEEFYSCIFVIKDPLPGVLELISERCGDVVTVPDSLHEELSIISQLLKGNEIVVLDGYSFNTEYQQVIKRKAGAVICIDDIHAFHFLADVVVNPAGGTDHFIYSKEHYTKIYSGPQYAFLKKPFLKPRDKNQQLNNVLICMGGADPHNFTSQALEIALKESFDTYFVIIGEAFRDRSALKAITENSKKDIRVESNLSAASLADTMAQCAAAITSASGIAYEYLSSGGELYCMNTADNQRLLYEYLTRERLCIPFETFRCKDKEFIRDLLTRQKKVFDGLSGHRLARIVHHLDFNINVSVRRVIFDDLTIFFKWANDPTARAHSYSAKSISLDEHTQWFTKKLQDQSSTMLIFEYKGTAAGTVRFDIGKYTTISYSLDSMFRGRGWGECLLRKALDFYRHKGATPQTMVGFVKTSNASSVKIFRNLNFSEYVATEYPDSYRYELTLN